MAGQIKDGKPFLKKNDKVEKRDDFLTLNKPSGDFADVKSLIWPFRLFKGIQPFDLANGRLVVPHVAGKMMRRTESHSNRSRHAGGWRAFLGQSRFHQDADVLVDYAHGRAGE